MRILCEFVVSCPEVCLAACPEPECRLWRTMRRLCAFSTLLGEATQRRLLFERQARSAGFGVGRSLSAESARIAAGAAGQPPTVAGQSIASRIQHRRTPPYDLFRLSGPAAAKGGRACPGWATGIARRVSGWGWTSPPGSNGAGYDHNLMRYGAFDFLNNASTAVGALALDRRAGLERRVQCRASPQALDGFRLLPPAAAQSA